MAYEFLSFFFFFGGSLKWILTSFFAVYLSFLAIIRNKGKVKATSLPLLGCTFSSSLSLQVVFPLYAILSKAYLGITAYSRYRGITVPPNLFRSQLGTYWLCKHRQVPSPTCRQALHWCLETGASPSYDFCKG